jgi:hypothetical protein
VDVDTAKLDDHLAVLEGEIDVPADVVDQRVDLAVIGAVIVAASTTPRRRDSLAGHRQRLCSWCR